MTFAQRYVFNWPILVLLTLTGTFAASVPVSCMPVLFKEISDDLGLSLVQIGTIWGVANLAGIFMSVIGGVISDRLGLRVLLTVFCILVGITGALRGLSDSFFTLMVTVFINGVARLVIPISVSKAIGIWFKGPRLGTAMGISAMGIGLGLTLGPMISATVVSPLVGGWRNVMYLYGALSLLVGLVWGFFGREPAAVGGTGAGPSPRAPVRATLYRLLRTRSVWLISFGMLFRIGCIMGVTGYLALYLLGQGWEPAAADGTLAIFYAVSAALVIPFSLISDRLHSRKAILIPATVLTTVAVGLMPIASGGAVWFLAVFAGMFLDGFMAITVTTLLETEGIGPSFSGTALGIIFSISQIGAVFSPPIGNSFAAVSPGTPFFFWAGLSLVSLVIVLMLRETARR
jgi:CP family cyanate transporter-like MFS transporter